MSISSRIRATAITAVLALSLVLSAAAFTPSQAKKRKSSLPWKNWISTQGQDHVLAGRVWSTKHGVYLTPGELADILSIHDFILLGEIHDNPDHHRLQAWLIGKIVRHNRKPAIVMEMIQESQQETLDAYLKGYKNPVAKLGPAIGWKKRGWPDWKIYAPIARSAYAYRLPIIFGSADRSTTKAIGKKGFDGIEAAQARDLTLDQPIDRELTAALRKELEQSHCGMIKGKSARAMVKIQQFRDAFMASQMLKAGNRKGAFLIAGNGHVRTDRGVPFFLKRQEPYFQSASLMLVEVREDAKQPKDLVDKDTKGAAAADFVWFTPRLKRPDPCEQFKKHMRKKRQTKPAHRAERKE